MKNYVSAVALTKRRLPQIILTVLGALGGYLYSMFMCTTAACAITSNLIILTVYCGVLGFLFGNIVTPDAKTREGNIHE